MISPDIDYVSLKKMAEDERPREKLVTNGSGGLSNAEILGILIGSGTVEMSAVELCRKILQSVNNDLDELARLTIYDLMKFKGIGQAKAVSIAAALELGRRRQTGLRKKNATIRSSKDVFQLVRGLFQDLNHEEFYAIFLSRANRVKSVEQISKGGISGTTVDGKIIFNKALAQNASAIVLCHNHPSGNLNPSRSDIDLTKKIKEFGSLIDITIWDHLIVAHNRYFSFADQDLI